MHSLAIKALEEKITDINGKIEASYQNEWCVEDSDKRNTWTAEIESLQSTIEFLESVK